MEKTIVQFILDNIFLFAPIGSAGIAVTALLLFWPQKKSSIVTNEIPSDSIRFFRIHINFYILIYLLIWIVIIIIGLFSDYFLPTLLGAIIASIPLILIRFIGYISIKSKER
jgi:hypothetical protein